MMESPLTTFLLVLITLCAVTLTLSLLIAAGFLCRTSCRLNLLMADARQILSRTDRAAGQVENVVGRACATAQNLFDQVHRIQENLQAFWSRPFGSGNPSRSRGRNHGHHHNNITRHVTNKRRTG